MNDVTVLSPFVQWGFAGFSFLLLALLFWLVKQVLILIEKITEVITENTNAIKEIGTSNTTILSLLRDIHDLLIGRPCLRGKD